MSTKFVVESDVSSASQGLSAVEKGMDKVGDAAQEMSADMQAAFDNANRIQDLKEQVGDLTEALHKAENQAKETNAELGNPGAGKSGGDGLGKWTALFTGIGAGMQLMEKFAQGVVVARQVIQQLADNGSENFVRLNDKINALSNSWEDFKSNVADSSGGGLLSNTLSRVVDTASAAAENVDILAESLTLQATTAAKDAAELLGWTSAANLAAVAQKNFTESLEKGAEAQEEERKQRQLSQVGDMRSKLEAQRAAQQEAEGLKEIKTTQELTAKINEQFAAMEAMAKQGALNATERQAAAKKLQDLERRRIEIIKEAAEKEKKISEDATREAEEQAKIHEAYQAKQLEERVQRIRDELAAEMQAEREALAARLKMHEEFNAARKKQIDELANTAEVKSVAGQINAAATDPRAIARRLADQAADTATAQAATDSHALDERKIEEIRRKAFRQAMNQQAGRGPQGENAIFSQQQLAQAAADNASAMTQSLEKGSNISSTAIDAVQTSIQAIQQNASIQDQQEQRIRGLEQAAQELLKNSRTRAQTMGRKQT